MLGLLGIKRNSTPPLLSRNKTSSPKYWCRGVPGKALRCEIIYSTNCCAGHYSSVTLRGQAKHMHPSAFAGFVSIALVTIADNPLYLITPHATGMRRLASNPWYRIARA
jgi:hypothetical protein